MQLIFFLFHLSPLKTKQTQPLSIEVVHLYID